MSNPVSSSGPADPQPTPPPTAVSSAVAWGELAAAAGSDKQPDEGGGQLTGGPFIQLGHTTLPVSEALQLKAEMIVRLDQQSEDLVWLIVDGQPRAAGLLLEVDGQFALQITELADSLTSTDDDQHEEGRA
jgi:hypothetical protein